MAKLQAADFWQLKGTIKRYPYLLAGFLLFAVKYNLDRFISYVFFNKPWYIIDYFIKPDILLMNSTEQQQAPYYLALGLTALPFIWFGTVLTIKRLRDIQLPLWLTGFFFLPLVNFLFFSLLSILPSAIKSEMPEAHKNRFLDRVIPRSNYGNALVAVGSVTVLAVITTFFSVQLLQEYGWSLFVGIPFFLGLGSTLLYGYHQPRTMKECLSVSFSAVLLFGVLLFVLAMEGIVCIVMAAPLGVILSCLGGGIGYFIQKRTVKSTGALLSVFAIIPLSILLEFFTAAKPPLVAVTTTVIIHQAPQKVWDNLVGFNEMKEPAELIFRSGVAYPIRAEIAGRGVGAVRNCVFTTGAFVEPVEVWDEPKLLKFSVKSVPPPLVEISFYKDLHLPHLEGFFVSEKGQFVLTDMGNNTTRLEGTTWYRHNIWPGAYWQLWSDYILHTIHKRVLTHIKEKAEQGK